MTVQVVNVAGQEIALLPLAEYQRLVEIAEEIDDIVAADRANERSAQGEEYVPIELLDRIIAGEHPLRVWRQYRGMTLAGLAKVCSMSRSYLSEIETGRRQGKPSTWRALADALGVMVDDILPVTDVDAAPE